MWAKKIVAFLMAVAVSWAAAGYRFRDSGHAMGRLSVQGGGVRHAVQLEPGRKQYVVVVTATVLPPYRGNVRVTVEGQPDMECRISGSRPVIDLGLRRRPVLRGEVLEGLEPRDKFALWFVLRPRHADGSGAGPTSRIAAAIAFRDTRTGQTLLEVPLASHAGKEACDAGHN